MTAIVFPINPYPGYEFTADNNVTYKWEEDGTTWGVWRALGGVPDEPEIVELAKPEILYPPKGSGDVTYTPKTSDIVTVDTGRGGPIWIREQYNKTSSASQMTRDTSEIDPDGNLYETGRYVDKDDSNKTYGWLQKSNRAGDIIWSKWWNWDSSSPSTANYSYWKTLTYKNGGLYCGGMGTLNNDTITKGAVVRLDPDANVEDRMLAAYNGNKMGAMMVAPHPDPATETYAWATYTSYFRYGTGKENNNIDMVRDFTAVPSNNSGSGSSLGGRDIMWVDNDNFVILANDTYSYSGSNTYSLNVFKIEAATGNLVWTKPYRYSPPANKQAFGYAIDKDTSGNLYIAGRGQVGLGGGSKYDGLLIKLDADGNEIFKKAYGESGLAFAFYDMKIFNDEIYVTGYTMKGGVDDKRSMYVGCLNLDGSVKWENIMWGGVLNTGQSTTLLRDQNSLVITSKYEEDRGLPGSTKSLELMLARVPMDGSALGTYGKFTYESTTSQSTDLTAYLKPVSGWTVQNSDSKVTMNRSNGIVFDDNTSLETEYSAGLGLVLTDNKAYNKDDGTEVTTISEGFKAGDKVYSSTDNSIVGTLIADADDATKTMTLTDVTGTWENGMEVINLEEKNAFGPDADTLQFISSTPEVVSGTVTNWGSATWTVSENSDMSDPMVTQKAIVPDSEQTLDPSERGDIVLEGGKQYYATVQYSSGLPIADSEVSETTDFETKPDGPAPGWFPAMAAEQNKWQSVTYGEPVIGGVVTPRFVAVSAKSGSYQVMHSPDGIDWESSNYVEYWNWTSVAYGEGKYVAVCTDGSSKKEQIMWSTDGVDWNKVALPMSVSASNEQWKSVTYGNGRFVAVTTSGYRGAMWADATDLTTWKKGNPPPSGQSWKSVAYGNNMFVAVATNSVKTMKSTDGGETWQNYDLVEHPAMSGITFGNGTFVAVGTNPTKAQVQYTTNGEDWTAVNLTSMVGEKNWVDVTYADGKFVAVGGSGYDGLNQVMWADENDLDTWYPAAQAESNSWESVTYGGDKFVAVSKDGTNRVMYSYTGTGEPNTRYYDADNDKLVSIRDIIGRFGDHPDNIDLNKYGIYELTEQPTYTVRKYVRVGNKYKPIRDYQSEIQALTAKIASLEDS